MHINKLTRALTLTAMVILSVSVRAQEGGPPPVPVELTKPKVETVHETISATGVLMAKSSVIITPEVPGRVQTVSFTEGTKVEKDAVLYQLDNTLLKAEFKKAQATFDNAKTQYERQEKLAQAGTGNTAARDDALAKLNVESAQLEYIKVKIDQMTINAPFAGFVGLSKVEVGDYVAPSAAMVNLEDLETLRIDFKIPETYLGDVKPNQTFMVRFDGFPDQTFTGKVIAIDPAIDARIHSVKLRGHMDNPQNKLRPGLFAKIELILQTREKALLIPETCVQLSQDGPFVYVVVDGSAVLTPVRTGIRQDGYIEIVKGIQMHDDVVTSGQNRLYNGAQTYPSQP